MKKNIHTKTASILFIVALFSTGYAFGAPTPKTYSTVTKDTITLGDVFDGVKENVDFYLAPAPEIGQTKILSNKDLVRISKTLDLGWEPKNTEQRTIIRRAANSVQSSDIERILEKESSKLLTGKDFEITLLNQTSKFYIPEGADKTLSLESFNYNAADMTITAIISCKSKPEIKNEVKALISYINKIPVLSEPKSKDDVITLNDLEYIKVKSADIRSGMIMNSQDLVGKTPRNNLAAMTPIFENNLKLPTIVKRGQIVTMALKNNKLSLTTQGLATQDGKKGDIIKIENISSKKIITAVVTGEREVSIVSTGTTNSMM